MAEKQSEESIKAWIRRAVPLPVYRALFSQESQKKWPPIGLVRLGSLDTTQPISSHWGMDRGLPVVRYYIERFLARCAADIRGSVLEIADDNYTRKFGGERVTRADILHVNGDNPRATIVADLTRADHIPSDSFDCIIVTQTLNFIYDASAAVATLHRILKPGGVLLASVPGICKMHTGQFPDYWHFTRHSGRRLFEEAFGPDHVTVEARGNVLAAVALLHGLAVEELRQEDLDYPDHNFDVVILLRAVKRPSAQCSPSKLGLKGMIPFWYLGPLVDEGCWVGQMLELVGSVAGSV